MSSLSRVRRCNNKVFTRIYKGGRGMLIICHMGQNWLGVTGKKSDWRKSAPFKAFGGWESGRMRLTSSRIDGKNMFGAAPVWQRGVIPACQLRLVRFKH